MAKNTGIDNTPAIVIKLDSITGLDTARILSGYGIPVYGIADDRRHYCTKTGACRGVFFTDTSGDGLVGMLLDLAAKFKSKPVLFPCSDESVRLISARRETLREFYNFVIPDDDVLLMYMNKESFYRRACQKGFPVPDTFLLETGSGLESLSDEAEFPLIVKPALKSPEWIECFKDKVIKVNTRAELGGVIERASKITKGIIVQKWIKGGDSNLVSSIFYYGRNGALQASFVSRKLRQWYTENGDACLAEECRNDEVARIARELLSGTGFSGIGSIEFKLDDESGEYYILEANVGRPVTRIGMTEAAGVPVLYTMYCDASGLPLPRDREQKYRGTKWISFHRDLQASWKYYRDGKLTIWGWLKSLYGVRSFAVLSLRDPMPFISLVGDGLSGLFKNPAK
ncbi:MAG TPA: carboxylate--amine ligase [Thermodesulfobacteriota bacterium]|nr:carboxylate--amine ligase [Thermodesulfobacteriota bacterium]